MNKIDSQKEIEKFIQNRRVKQEVENAIREKILETHVKHHFLYGKKHDTGKRRMSLVPHEPLNAVIDVLEFGANKYGANNWRHVPNARERYFNAAHRHLNAWWAGEKVDSESGLPHLAHAVCCLMFLMWFDGVGDD